MAATLNAVPDNLFVVCSKSGKLKQSLVKKWSSECLSPHITSKTLLLIDSWSAQGEDVLKESLSEEQEENLDVIKIPPGTTGECQPLDVYFFRQYKLFVRTIYDMLALQNVNDCRDRLSILNMHSLVHNQLTASIFQPMLKYAWFKSGYKVPNPGKFKNMKQVCFENFIRFTCEECIEGEKSTVSVRCAHCKKHLCLPHFLQRKCWHA